MHVCALTLCMWIIFGVQNICLTMVAMSSLLGWWCWDVGCCMWLLIKYMMLRLSVNMYVSCCVVGMFCRAMSIALSYAMRMFGYPGSLSEIRVLLCGLNIHELAVLPIICPSEFLDGGMNDPSIYMHCCGGYLRGWVWLYVMGKGDMGVVMF